MENTITAEDLKEAARSFGADLIGIASIDRFEGVARDNHPAEIFPEAESVIVIARRIPRGALRGVEEGTQFHLYRTYGYDWIDNRFLATTTYKTAEFLEDNGYEAVPLLNLPTQMGPMGVAISEDRPAPNVLVDFDDAAVRAGMGEIDYGGFLLTPEYGTLQRIQMILTEAEFEPDTIPEEPINDLTAEQYASMCPLSAIDSEHSETIEICGKSLTIGKINFSKCRDCKNGAIPNQYHDAGNPDRVAAVCGRSLISHLQNAGRLTKTYKNKFRKRPVWNIVDNRVYQEEGSEIE